ncbi:MAG: hypothetical protein PWQ67_2429 [Clostridia bacterium]|jgi:hypothetical protein|nr:hypothetical protein [Clostridia bacterium]MDN5323975.1 hypothetical protein [Clostridia bacterium]
MTCNQEKNKANCSCTYEPCARKGNCCACIAYHRNKREAPGCLFPADIEKTYDRSLKRLATCYK